jgi:hypothetical protein
MGAERYGFVAGVREQRYDHIKHFRVSCVAHAAGGTKLPSDALPRGPHYFEQQQLMMGMIRVNPPENDSTKQCYVTASADQTLVAGLQRYLGIFAGRLRHKSSSN